MRAAVISDTHLARPSPWFMAVYERHLAPADLLIHCGDITGQAVWAYLLQHKNFQAVSGNMDDYQLASTLPGRLELTVAGYRVAATHGWGMRPGLAARIAAAFGPGFDLIFFGHSHAQEDVVIDGVRLINPGALQPGGSLALVEFTAEGVDVRHVGV